MASIQLKNLTKTFGDGLKAVDSLDLDIQDGEFVVFVGPSGCGKSTTLRMIAGLESVTSGEISIGDRMVNTVAPKDRDIAMVFQNYALYPHLSVGENMGFSLRMNKMPKPERQERVLEAAKMLGLETILNKKPGQLSGGQRQRVALGRAVVRKPAVFLFDEPLSNLDPDRRASTRSEIRRIQRELGTTTVYVTHDHEEAMALGDKIVIMDQGVLQQSGPPKHVFEKPVNRFVGTFLGTPRMNTMNAVVDTTTGSPVAKVQLAEGELSIPVISENAPTLSGGQDILVGLRPHCISPSTDAQPGHIQFDGEILDIERLGFAVDVHTAIGSHTVLARIPGQTEINLGDQVRFSFDPQDVHVFTQ
ncbi:MAG: ABC transporter ATP-binding protein [Phycisphaerales bacterium]